MVELPLWIGIPALAASYLVVIVELMIIGALWERYNG